MIDLKFEIKKLFAFKNNVLKIVYFLVLLPVWGKNIVFCCPNGMQNFTEGIVFMF